MNLITRFAPLSWKIALAVAALFVGVGARSANAQTYAWTATGSSNWNNIANWDSGTDIPVSAVSTILNFAGTTSYTATSDFANGFLLNQMNFNGTGATMTITLAGNSLSLSANGATTPTISVASTDVANVVIGNAIALSAATNISNASTTGTIKLSGVISGSSALTISGAGTTIFSNAANTFTSKITVSTGILSVGADLNLGAAPGATVPAAITLDGGTLKVTAAITINQNRGITLTSNGGTIDLSATGATTTTYFGHITGTGGLTIAFGSSNANFNVSDNISTPSFIWNYSGNTQMTGTGTFTVNNNAGQPTLPSTTVLTMDPGIIWVPDKNTNYVIAGLQGLVAGTGSVNCTNAASQACLTINNTGNFTYANVIQGPAFGVVKTGTGTETLTGNLTFNGTNAFAGLNGGISAAVNTALYVNAGTLILSGNNTYGATDGTVVASGGTLLLNNTAGSGTGAGTVTVKSGGTIGGNGIISSGAKLVSIQGILSPGGAAATVGTLTITSTAATAISGTYAWELATAGTSGVSLNSGGSTPALPQTNHDLLVVNGSLNMNGSSVTISSLGAAGATGFNATMSYSWLLVSATGALSNAPTTTLTISGGSSTDFSTATGSFTLGTAGSNLYLNYTPGNNWTGLTSGNWTDTGSWSLGAIPGSGQTAFFSQASPNLTVGLGGTAQPIGSIVFSSASAAAYVLGNAPGDAFLLNAGGAITVNGNVTTAQTFNAALQLLGALTITNNGASTLTFNGNLSLGSGGTAGLLTFTGTGNTFVAGSIGSTAISSLTMSGSGTLALSGVSTYSGGTAIANGTLQLGVTNALPVGTTVTFGSNTPTNGIFDMNGFNQTIAGLAVATGATAGNQTIGNSSTSHNSNLTYAGSGASTFGGVIKDTLATGSKTVALTVSSGSLNLTNANTYSGGTTVSGGTLFVNNSTGSGAGSGTVTVNAGGILGGSGSISSGANLISIAGTVSPGNSPGTLTLTSTTTVALSGTYLWELATAGTPGVGPNTGGSTSTASQDSLVINGSLNMSGSKVTISSLGAAGATGFNPIQLYSWLIATTTGGITNASSTVTISGASSTDFSGATGTFSLGVAGNNLYLNYAAPQDFWTGASSANWNTAGNWFTNAVPVSGKTAFFNGAGNGHTTISLGGVAQPISAIQFQTSAVAAYTLGNGAGDAFLFDSGGNITVNLGVTSAQTFNAALQLLGPLTATNNGSSTLTFNGNMTLGSGGTAGLLTFTGTGNITLASSISGAAVSAISMTGSGTLAVNASLPSAPLFTVASGQVNFGAGVSAGAVVVTGGTLNTGTGSSIATGDLSAGTGIVNAATPLTVTNQLKLNGGYSLSGNFTAQGSNLVDNTSTPRTFTLASGTATWGLPMGLANITTLNRAVTTYTVATGTVAGPSLTVSIGASVLVVGVAARADAPSLPNTLSWGSQTLTLAVAATSGNGTSGPGFNRDVGIYYLFNPTPGTNMVTGTIAGPPTYVAVNGFTLSGVNTTVAPLTGSMFSGLQVASTAIAGISAQSAAFIEGINNADDVTALTLTATSGNAAQQLWLQNDAGPNTISVGGLITGLAAGSTTFNQTLNGTNWVRNTISTAVFTPASGFAPINMPNTNIVVTGTSTMDLGGPTSTIETLGSLSVTASSGAGTIFTIADATSVSFNGIFATGASGSSATISPGTNAPVIVLASDGAIDVPTGVTLTINSAIGGTGLLSKTSAGTLILNAVNSYTGGTTIVAGTLQMGIIGALPATGLVTLGATGAPILDLHGFNQTIGGLSSSNAAASVLLGSANLTIGNATGSPVTYAGTISGTGSLITQGPITQTQILSGNNSYGATTLNGGTLQVSGNANLGTGPVTLNGGVLSVAGGANAYYFPTTTFASAGAGGGLSVTNPGGGVYVNQITSTFTGPVTIGVTTSVVGFPSYVVLSNAGNNFIATNITIIGNSVLSVSSDSALGDPSNNVVAAQGPGNQTSVWQITGTTAYATSRNYTSTGGSSGFQIDVLNTAGATFNGVISSGGRGLTKTGPGSLTLNNANSFTSGTYGLSVFGGTVIADAQLIGNPFGANTNFLNLNGGLTKLEPNSGGQTTTNVDHVGVGGGAYLTIDATPTSNVTTLNLTNVQNFGAFSLNTNGVAPTVNGTIVLSPGAGMLSSATNGFSGTAAFQMGTLGALPLNGPGIAAPWIVVQRDASSTDADFATSVINSNSGFAQVDRYTGESNFDGTMPGSNATAYVANSGTNNVLQGAVSAFSLKVEGVIISDAGSNTLTLGSGAGQAGLILNNGASISATTLAFGGAAGFIYTSTTSTISSQVTGTAGLTIFGPGTLILTNATNSFVGGNGIGINGTLQVTADGDLGAAVNNLAFGGGKLIVAANGFTSARKIVILGGATISVTTGNTATFSGVVSDAAISVGTANNTPLFGLIDLIVNDSVNKGTLILSGANTYQGTTTINNGVLSVSSLANGGVNSGIGASTSIPTNLVFNGGTLQYTGAGATTDRLFTLNASSAIDASGTGPLVFSNTGTLAYYGTGPLTLTLTGTNTGANTFSPLIADGPGGATSLVKAGPGTFVLPYANSYSGGTTINGGILSFGAGALGTIGTIAFTGSSTLQWSGTNTQDVSSRVVVNDGVNATFDTNGNNVVFANPIGVGALKTAALTKTGGGTLFLTTPNTYSGGTTILNGTLNINSDSALGAAAGAVNLTGGTLQFSAGGGVTLNISRNIVLLGGAFDTNSGNDTIAGVISGSDPVNSNFIKNGAGTLILTNTNTYAGSTFVNAGALAVPSTSNLSSGALIVGNSNTALPPTQTFLYLFNAAQTVGPLSGAITDTADGNRAAIFLSPATTLTVNQTAAATYQGIVFGGGSVVLSAASNNTLQLSGNSTYSGSTTINGGTIQLNVANALPTSTALTLAAAGTLNLNNFNQTVFSLAGAGSINTGSGAGGILTVKNNNDPTFVYAGVMSGTGGLNVNLTAGSIQQLTGANTYTGPTNVNGGTLQIGGNGVLSNGATATVLTTANTAGAVFDLNNFNVTTGPIQGGGVLGGGILLGLGTGATGSGGTLTIKLPFTSTFAGNITGNGNLILSGSGTTLILTGNNNINGSISADSYVAGSVGTSAQVSVPAGTGNGLDMKLGNQRIASLVGGDSSGNNAAFTGNGVIDSGGVGPTLTVAAAASFPAIFNFSGGLWNDVSLTLDSSFNNISQVATLSGVSVTTGKIKVGNYNNAASTATTMLIVTGTLGDASVTGGTGGLPLLTVDTNGVLAGTGTINVLRTGAGVTVNDGGTIRGGIPNGSVVAASNYGTLSIGTNSASQGQSLLTINNLSGNSIGGGTILTEVHRTNSPLTSNNFTLMGGSVAAGDASLISVTTANKSFALGTGTSSLGTAAFGGSITIQVLDTNGSLVKGESYTFNLVTAASIRLNGGGVLPGGTVIDSSPTGAGIGGGTTGGDLGLLGIGNVLIMNSSQYAAQVAGWSLGVDSTGHILQLTVTSVPEPEHVMLMCVGVLLAGLAIRRRLRGALTAC